VLDELTSVPAPALRREIADIRAYLKGFAERTPAAMYTELDALERRLDGASGA
jgi:GTP-dependent phosphoenolpyruvate carboxykinase